MMFVKMIRFKCFKLIGTFIILTIMFLIIFKMHLSGNHSHNNERCLSELTFLKYKLNEVTEYKNHIDKLLTESQKAHKNDKEVFNDMIESCVAMKQQSLICQSQFEDLHNECKAIKEKYDELLHKTIKNSAKR